MNKYKTFYYRIVDWFFSKVLAVIQWRNTGTISGAQLHKITAVLSQYNCIILIHRRNHLSSILIAILSFLKTGRKADYSHALLNIESEGEYTLVETTSKGTNFVDFDVVFDCHKVCLLYPKQIEEEEWIMVIEKTKKQLGKPYDNLGDPDDDSRLTCVELVRTSLMAISDYDKRFGRFESVVKQEDFLLPDMIRYCGDFEVMYETGGENENREV